MAETYSLGATGRRADQTPAVTNFVKVGDTAGTIGAQQLAMAQGTPILCKNLDGSRVWYVIDAERSSPDSIVLKAV